MSRSLRLWRVFAVVVWLVALGCATAGLTLGRAVFERGVVYGDPGPALPDLDGPQRAINTQLETEPGAEAQRRTLRMIREAGFGAIRQEFEWGNVEVSGKGQYFDSQRGTSNWAPYDQIVDLANAEGLNVIARLDRPPGWARPAGSTKSHPPNNAQDYADFVAAFVSHFSGRVHYVQLWNEPNLIDEWGQRPVDPAGYVELLKAGYGAAKRADPSVRVLIAEMAPTREPDSPAARGLDDLVYLQRLYEHGAKPYFDIMAANAYGLLTGPDDRQVGDRYTNFPRVLLIRDLMVRHDDAGKAMWVVEFGWNALPPDWRGNLSPWGQVSPAKQAQYTLNAYNRALLEWPWMGPMALWIFRIPHADVQDPTPYFGVVDGDWQPRPIYRALAATVGESAVLGPGFHQETSAALTYEKTWQWTADPTASLGGLRETPISGATVRLKFHGNRIALVAPAGPDRGTAYVRVNGAYTLANRLPLNANGQATLDFYSPRNEPQRRFAIADGLPDRVHDVELTVSGEHEARSSGPGVGIDAFVVERDRPLWPFVALGAAWGVSALAVAWAARRPILEAVGAGTAAGAATHGAPLEAFTAWAPVARALAVPWRRVLIYAIAACLSLSPLTVRTPAGRYPVVELLLLVLLAVSALRLYWDGALKGWVGAYAGPATLLVIAGLISLVVADYPRLGLRELRSLVIEPVLFYFLARAALRGTGTGRALAGAFVSGAACAAALALGQTVVGRGLVVAEGVRRAAALYPSPNNLALLLDRALPLAVALAVYSRVDSGRAGRSRVVFWLVVALCALAVFFTFSRAAWVACAAAVLFLLWPTYGRSFRLRRQSALAAGAVTIPLLFIAAALALRVERFRSVFNRSGTAFLRLYLWEAALHMVRDHPLWGVGLDQFLYQYPRYMLPEAWREPNLSHPHNVILDFWLRLGLLGLVALGWALWIFAHQTRRTFVGRLTEYRSGGSLGGRSLGPGGSALALGAAAALLASLVHGMVDNSYFVTDLAYAFWIVLLLSELAGESSHQVAGGATAEPGILTPVQGRGSRVDPSLRFLRFTSFAALKDRQGQAGASKGRLLE